MPPVCEEMVGTVQLVIKDDSRMKVRDAIELLETDGWYQVKQKGSHRQFKHPIKRGRVTIAGNRNDDLAPGTLKSILKQAQLREN